MKKSEDLLGVSAPIAEASANLNYNFVNDKDIY